MMSATVLEEGRDEKTPARFENGDKVRFRLLQPARGEPAVSSPRADARPLRGCGA